MKPLARRLVRRKKKQELPFTDISDPLDEKVTRAQRGDYD
jgi:hypothetical protein